MGLFGRSKKHTDAGTFEEEKIQVKTPDQIQNDAGQNELEQIKKEIQESWATLNTTSYQLDKLKNEFYLVSNELVKSKQELESNKTEISKLRSEHKSILDEIQLAKADLALIKSQYDKSEVVSIKEKIESARKEFDDMNSKIANAKSELNSLQSEYETKAKEIALVKKELEFIEKELARVGREDRNKKIVEAAGSVVASINAQYDAVKKELKILRTAYERLRVEYETRNRAGIP